MNEPKTIATNGLKNACKILLEDLQALPEDSFDKCFGGKARTVADIVYEVNLVNDGAAMGIRGEQELPWPEDGWVKAPADCKSKTAVIASFEKSSAKIIELAESLSPEQYEETISIDGEETTRFARFRFMMLHIWYHSGQLNFIQTLLGDENWHWT